MADLPESRNEPVRTGPASPPSRPRWVKVSAVILVVAVLLIAALLVLGGEDHGPGRHSTSGDAATPASAIDDATGHERPEGGH